MKRPKKYLSLSKLGLDYRQFAALLSTRALLASGGFKHEANPGGNDVEGEVFNMAWWNESFCHVDRGYGCGTARCIGGTMEWLLGEGSNLSELPTEAPINKLFFPHDIEGKWEDLTTDHAIAAIDNFLYYGKPKWKQVVKNGKGKDNQHRYTGCCLFGAWSS